MWDDIKIVLGIALIFLIGFVTGKETVFEDCEAKGKFATNFAVITCQVTKK